MKSVSLRVLLAWAVLWTSCPGARPTIAAPTGFSDPPAPPPLAWPEDNPILDSDEVGYLPGGGTVTAMGDYQYTLPLDVPDGRAGVAPDIALVYGSAGGRDSGAGPLGVGWTVSHGGSEIAPCARTFLHDGTSDVPNYHGGDALCLDGQRLIPLPGTDGEYRTFRDTFAKIVARRGEGETARRFEVFTRGGRIRTYEPLSAKRIPPVLMTFFDGEPGALGPAVDVTPVWVLTSERDRSGNAMLFSYEVRSQQEAPYAFEAHVSSIAYTARLDDRGRVVEAPRRRVVFEYSERPDPRFAYQNGLRTASTRRLVAIKLHAPNPEREDLVGQYRLAYDPDPTRSRLVSVHRYDDSGFRRLWERRFEWARDERPRFAVVDPPHLVGRYHRAPLVTFDVENDGREDLYLAGRLCRTTVTSTTPFDTCAPRSVMEGVAGRFVDVNGDGKVDVLKRVGPDDFRFVTWNRATSAFDEFDYGVASTANLIDANGDGLVDAFVLGPRRNPLHDFYEREWYLRLNHGHGFDEPRAPRRPAPYMIGRKSIALDWNGDGRGELHTGFHPLDEAELPPEEEGPRPPTRPPNECAQRPRPPWQYHAVGLTSAGVLVDEAYHPSGSLCRKTLADLNGDGLQDILVAKREGLRVRYNTGTGFLPSEDAGAVFFPRLGKHSFDVADIDGDGREDLISSSETGDFNGHGHLPGTYLHLRTNDGFRRVDLREPPYGIPAFDPQDFPPNLENASPLIKPADVNGDGLLDLVVVLRNREQDTSKVRVLVQQWAPHDVIVKVWDEHSPEPRESVHYSPYTTDTPSPAACAYPARCLRGGRVVAREHWIHRQDVPDGFRRTAYEFDDLRMNARARTLLGFGRMTTVDLDSHARTIVTFDHATSDEGRFPFAGLPQEVWQITPILRTPVDPAADVQLPAVGPMTARVVHTRHTYERRFFHGGATYAVFEIGSTRKEWEQHVSESATLLDDGSATVPVVRRATRSFDAYGSEVIAAVWTEGGQRCQTSTSWQNDAASWLIGLAERVSVTCHDDGRPLPEPRLRTMEYDDRGLLTKVTVEPGYPELAAVTAYARRRDGQVMNVTITARGKAPRRTYIAYDEEGVYPRATWNTLGHTVQQLIHPAYGVPIVEKDLNGVETRSWYDGFARVREVAREGSARRAVRYEQDADVPWAVRVHQEDEAGGAAYTLLDDRGRALGAAHLGFDGQWIYERASRNRFDQITEDYRPAAGAAPAIKTTTTYDTLGRVLEVRAPNDARTTLQHSMFETTVTDPLGRRSRTVRDVDGRVVESLDRVDGRWIGMTYAYGEFGQLEDAVDPAGNSYHIEYDKFGRRTLLADPDRGVTRWTYNAFGEVESETDALAQTTKFDRDVVGRVTATVHTVHGRTSYEYDGSGRAGEINRLTSATSPDGVTTSYEHDDLARPKRTTWTIEGRSYDIERGYDALGRLDTLRYPAVPGKDRFTVRYVFNPRGYVARVEDATHPAAPKVVWEVTERNADGLLTHATLGNGFREGRQYDPATGELVHVETVRDGAALFAVSYARDLTGDIRSRTDHALEEPRIETFDYDDLDRLTSWTVHYTEKPLETTYDFDVLGNLTAVERAGRPETFRYAAVQPHAPSTREVDGQTASYFYDSRGRQIAGDGREITWKPFDLPSQIGQAGQLTTFSYDAFGTRIRKTRTSGGLLVEGTDTIARLYERRWSPAGETHVFYVQTPEGPAAQLVYDAGTAEAERTLYLHQEALGSVGLVTDSQGEEVERTYFDPFGEKVDVLGKPTLPLLGAVKLGFTGHRHDDELELINMRGRIFDPRQKRFLTPDPFLPDPLSSQSYNRYSYVTGNPLRHTDPTGFLPARSTGSKCERTGDQNVPFHCIAETTLITATPLPATTNTPGPGTGTSDDHGPKPPPSPPPPPPPVKDDGQRRWTDIFAHFSWGKSQAGFRQRLESSIRDVRTWVHDNIVNVPGLQPKSDAERDVDASGVAVGVYFDSTWLAPLGMIEQALAISDSFAVLLSAEADPEQKEEAALQATTDTIVLGLTLGMVRGPAHGNSLKNGRSAQGYVLLHRITGEVLKFGETTLGSRRYPKTFLDKHSAELKFQASGTKKEMHDWQHQMILEYKVTHGGKRPPLNRSDY